LSHVLLHDEEEVNESIGIILRLRIGNENKSRASYPQYSPQKRFALFTPGRCTFSQWE